MSGEATVNLSAQDAVDAARTHVGWVMGGLSWAFVLLALITAGIDLWAGVPVLSDTLIYILLGTWLFFFSWERLARDWMVRRQYRQSAAMRSPLRLHWDDQSITIDTDFSHANYRWDQFYRWAQSRRSLLLYYNGQMFIYLPRRDLPGGAAEEMAALLQAAGVREKGKRQSAQSRPISS